MEPVNNVMTCPKCGGAASLEANGEWSCYGECLGYGSTRCVHEMLPGQCAICQGHVLVEKEDDDDFLDRAVKATGLSSNRPRREV